MEPSKEAIAIRLTRLNRFILGKQASGGANSFSKKTIDREALLDALTVLYDECNEDAIKKTDELVRAFVDKYRSTVADLRRTRVCISDFDTIQVIGRGQFGDIHMVREKQTSDVYAMKIIRKEVAAKRGAISAEDERDVLASSTSQWIPKLQYAFQDNNSLYLVMELCSGGDLAGLLARRNLPLAERDAAFYIAEIAHALRALHNMGFVHRDVKPQNILLDRCGHVKLTDFGSSVRVSSESTALAAGTADYVAPELLAAAHCAARHSVCLQCTRGLPAAPHTACDYWSLGVIAFELVTLKRPFSSGEDDSVAKILSNVQKYEASGAPPPFPPPPAAPSPAWRALVGGLLRPRATKRFNYLDTLQHSALEHLSPHSIRDQAPPWVPLTRGPEDASHFPAPGGSPPPASAASFRARPPFGGQLPYVGFSYVAQDDSDETHSSGGFAASLDSTAIDLATFKSAEKLAVSRAREIAALQEKVSLAEAEAAAAAERARRSALDEAERVRAKLQAEITALALQNKRLERQIEIEKEERVTLERSIQEQQLNSKRRESEIRRAAVAERERGRERDAARERERELLAKVDEMRVARERAEQDAEQARKQQQHYKAVIEQAQHLRHRRLSEINVRAIESVAKERLLRRQTLTGCEVDTREVAARAAAAESRAAAEEAARRDAEHRAVGKESECRNLKAELEEVKRQLGNIQEMYGGKKRLAEASSEELKQVQLKLTQERVRCSTLQAQVQELQSSLESAANREAALEEQCSRTETRLQQRVHEAEARAADALREDARHRDKVNTLEQLVRQLEREVSALEALRLESVGKKETASDTESVGEQDAGISAQIQLLKEQLDKSEKQLQAKTEEIAALKQETRAANLARWRKEREYTDLQTESKTTTRDVKRLEERLSHSLEARKVAEQKANELKTELATLKPQLEQVTKDYDLAKMQLETVLKRNEAFEVEVDRSRNDIRKLKSELEYSERRRLHAETQEGVGARERAVLRDELHQLRGEHSQVMQNNKALQEACSLLEEQLSDLERLADINEQKNSSLERELSQVRTDLSGYRSRADEAERKAMDQETRANRLDEECNKLTTELESLRENMAGLNERLSTSRSRESSLQSQLSSIQVELDSATAAAAGGARRLAAVLEEAAALRTALQRAAARDLQLQAALDRAQEELADARESAEASAAWWRTRETKADATLRQQTKLIDFLQTKVEEAKRKKCLLSFGRSGRRTPVSSPPLRRANRELREEVERLKNQLAAKNGHADHSVFATPKREKKQINRVMSIDTPDCPSYGDDDDSLTIVWADGAGRHPTLARPSNGALVFRRDRLECRATLLSTTCTGLPSNEAQRAFQIKVESGPHANKTATVICNTKESRDRWIALLRATTTSTNTYKPRDLLRTHHCPSVAMYLDDDAVAIGCPTGLHSLRGPIRLEDSQGSEISSAITDVAVSGSHVAVASDGHVLCGATSRVLSVLRRSPALAAAINVAKLELPDHSAPILLQAASSRSNPDGPCLVVSCGRRVFILREDAARLVVARTLTIDRPPPSLLLTPSHLYMAGEKPLRIKLPSGALEQFAIEEPIVSAAAKKKLPPKSILLIKDNEILICYAEYGVFVDTNGKRTRPDDIKWKTSFDSWQFVNPFLYCVNKTGLTIIYVSDDAFRTPPCTCDNHSLASSTSDCYSPATFHMKLEDGKLLGIAPNGVIVRSQVAGEFSILLVEGSEAFRSIGASIESLETASVKGSSTDLTQSSTDVSLTESNHNVSEESVEARTGFLADIRKQAQQLRRKNREERRQSDDVLKILKSEVGMKRRSGGRMSPATISETSDSEIDDRRDHPKTAADVCAELFTRQVRFQ